ncbi:hypothetical protein BC832DRAFT_284085 [Gaertneriomyces semiglobifer]|nr:hypothetical protein BC832DRAFT_284085 [Gaertneriomyces semiglobifer]
MWNPRWHVKKGKSLVNTAFRLTMALQLDITTACVVGYQAILGQSGQAPTQAAAIAFCQEQAQSFMFPFLLDISKQFGFPGIVVGASLPFILIGLVIALLRLRKIVNARSICIFVATLGNLTFAGAITYGFKGIDAEFLISDVVGVTGFIIVLTFLSMAGILRYQQVITSRSKRMYFKYILIVVLLGFAGVMGYTAADQIINSPQYPTRFNVLFSALPFGPLLIYVCGGLFCFSRNLPKSLWKEAGNNTDVLKTLRRTNDIMMAAITVIIISQLAVLFPLRETAFNNSVACLHLSMCLFIENIFETTTNALRGKSFFSTPSSQITGASSDMLSRPLSMNPARVDVVKPYDITNYGNSQTTYTPQKYGAGNGMYTGNSRNSDYDNPPWTRDVKVSMGGEVNQSPYSGTYGTGRQT